MRCPAAFAFLAGRGESRHGLRGTEPSATEAQRHRENLKILCVSVSLWRIFSVSRSPWDEFCHGLLRAGWELLLLVRLAVRRRLVFQHHGEWTQRPDPSADPA